MITSLTKEHYENETPEVKEEVRKKQAQERVEIRQCQSLTTEEVNVESAEQIERTPREYVWCVILIYDSYMKSDLYLSAINSIPHLAHDFMRQLKHLTGWSFTISCGGPDPRKNGAITTMSVHSCTNIYGQSYAKATPDFQKTVQKPFSDYLHTIFRMFLSFYHSITILTTIFALLDL